MKSKYLCQLIFKKEREIIDIVEKEFIDNEFIINTIVHDGINVYHKSKRKTEDITEKVNEIIDNINKKIIKELKLNCIVKSKLMDTLGFSELVNVIDYVS